MKGCRPLTEAEVELMQASFGGTYGARDRELFLLGVKSGFRISELPSLRLGDVWQHGRLVDRVTVQRRHMKNKQESRTVLLHADAKTGPRDLAVHLTPGARVYPTDLRVPQPEGAEPGDQSGAGLAHPARGGADERTAR
jgi:integrase